LGAALASLEVAFGLDGLYCPRCGRVIFDDEISWDESTCPHVRFVRDWVGELWIAEPASVPAHQHAYQSWLAARLEGGLQELSIGDLAHRLPDSCLLLTVAEPGPRRDRGGATVTVALDLDPTAEAR